MVDTETRDATRDPARLAGGRRRLCRLKVLAPRDQVTATAWALVAVLSALREKRKDGDEARTALNRTGDEALAYLRHQIAALRFPTTR